MPSFFIWEDSFNTGMDEIDQQHRLVIEYLNACYKEVADETTIKPDHIKRLEEYLMQESDYPKYSYHYEQHRIFEDNVLKLRKEYMKGNRNIANRMLKFLIDWFVHHILETDMELISYINSIEEAKQ